MASGQFVRGPDRAFAPADARAQQQLRVARDQLENLHELDIENSGDRRRRCPRTAFADRLRSARARRCRATVSCCLARMRNSRSSFCRSVTSRQMPSIRTAAPFSWTTEAIASTQRSSFSVLRRKAVMHVIRLAAAHALLIAASHLRLILRVDVLLKSRERPVKTACCEGRGSAPYSATTSRHST